MSNDIDRHCFVTNVDFFSLIDKRSTIKNVLSRLDVFQNNWLSTHKRGGVTANTYDVFHALLSCLAPTMSDIQTKQQDLFLKSCEIG